MATPRQRLEELLWEEEGLKPRLEYLALQGQGMLETLARLLPLAVKSFEAWGRWLTLFKDMASLVGFEASPSVGGAENLRTVMEKLYWLQRDIKYFREVIARGEAAER